MHMATTSAKATMEIIDINKGYLVTECIVPYQSGYVQLLVSVFLLDVILFIVHSLHSYEYDDRRFMFLRTR